MSPDTRSAAARARNRQNRLEPSTALHRERTIWQSSVVRRIHPPAPSRTPPREQIQNLPEKPSPLFQDTSLLHIISRVNPFLERLDDYSRRRHNQIRVTRKVIAFQSGSNSKRQWQNRIPNIANIFAVMESEREILHNGRAMMYNVKYSLHHTPIMNPIGRSVNWTEEPWHSWCSVVINKAGSTDVHGKAVLIWDPERIRCNEQGRAAPLWAQLNVYNALRRSASNWELWVGPVLDGQQPNSPCFAEASEWMLKVVEEWNGAKLSGLDDPRLNGFEIIMRGSRVVAPRAKSPGRRDMLPKEYETRSRGEQVQGQA